MALPKKEKQVEPGIFKTVDGRYLLDFRPDGEKSKKIRKVCALLLDARAEKKRILARYDRGDFDNFARDNRRLKELCQKWFDIHGYSLTSGQKRLASLNNLCDALGNPIAKKTTAQVFLDYRKERLEKGITANHLNHELTYLKSVFNELERTELWSGEKPFNKIRKLKVYKTTPRYLEPEEMVILLNACAEDSNPDLLAVVRLSLATGCRFEEANYLERQHLHENHVDFVETKNGKSRSVKIDPKLYEELIRGRERKKRLFVECQKAFERVIKRTGIELPAGQCSRVLRHTVASYYMMGGGDILELNKLLGHGTIEMTMIYAHLSPRHLDKILYLNPLSQLGKK